MGVYMKGVYMSKVRLNANIEENVYLDFKQATQESHISMTEYLERLLIDEIRRQRYARLKNEFDSLADEPATKVAMSIDEECSNDGL